MTDISKHPLLKACYEACVAIEKLGCSPEQTDAVSRVSDMMRPLEALIDERDAALDQVAVLREAALEAHEHVGAEGYSEGSEAKVLGALNNTSATAQRVKDEIERDALEKAMAKLTNGDYRIQQCSGVMGCDWVSLTAETALAAILGEKEE